MHLGAKVGDIYVCCNQFITGLTGLLSCLIKLFSSKFDLFGKQQGLYGLKLNKPKKNTYSF